MGSESSRKRDKDITAMLAKGYRRSKAAEAVGLSRPAVTQRMARPKEDWEDFQPDPLQ